MNNIINFGANSMSNLFASSIPFYGQNYKDYKDCKDNNQSSKIKDKYNNQFAYFQEDHNLPSPINVPLPQYRNSVSPIIFANPYYNSQSNECFGDKKNKMNVQMNLEMKMQTSDEIMRDLCRGNFDTPVFGNNSNSINNNFNNNNGVQNQNFTKSIESNNNNNSILKFSPKTQQFPSPLPLPFQNSNLLKYSQNNNNNTIQKHDYEFDKPDKIIYGSSKNNSSGKILLQSGSTKTMNMNRDPYRFLAQKRKSYFQFGKTDRKKQYKYSNKIVCKLELEVKSKDLHSRYDLNKDSNFLTKEILSDDEKPLNIEDHTKQYYDFITNENKDYLNYDFGKKPLKKLEDYYNNFFKLTKDLEKNYKGNHYNKQ